MDEKEKIQYLTKEEHEGLGIGNPVSPRTMIFELPNNVPSSVKPIVIFPIAGYKELSLKVTQYNKDYDGTTIETTLDPNKANVINLNMGVEL